jgi:hypothetical protein
VRVRRTFVSSTAVVAVYDPAIRLQDAASEIDMRTLTLAEFTPIGADAYAASGLRAGAMPA